jgi:hypothetical protein
MGFVLVVRLTRNVQDYLASWLYLLVDLLVLVH